MLYFYKHIQQADMETNYNLNAEDKALLREKCSVIDCGSGKDLGMPLFLRDDGEEHIAKRKKELEVYVKLWNSAPENIFDKTALLLNPHTLDPNEVGAEEARKIKEWFNETTKRAVMFWLVHTKHKVNGKFGGWSNGSLGSRWADCKIEGRNCRIAFYSRKTDENIFPPEGEERGNAPLFKGKSYCLMIDPTL